MADDDLTVVRADGTVKTLRSADLIGSGKHAQIVLVSDAPESVPSLTGGTLVLDVDESPAVALDPPTAAARICFIRAWETTQQTNKRLFYRRENTAPTADGANAEGFLLHGEGRFVRLSDFTQFKMIGETGSVWKVTCEWTNN